MDSGSSRVILALPTTLLLFLYVLSLAFGCFGGLLLALGANGRDTKDEKDGWGAIAFAVMKKEPNG